MSATELVIGSILGIGSSYFAWYITAHKLAPKLRFSDKISCLPTDREAEKFAYRVKLENPGKRPIIDLNITAKLQVPGLNANFPKNKETTYLPVSFSGQFPYVEPSKNGKRYLLRIRIDKEQEFSRQIYPANIREKAKDNTLMLEDLLSIKDSTVQLIALGYDSFSGARKAFLSPKYSFNDICKAPFDLGSLEVAKINQD